MTPLLGWLCFLALGLAWLGWYFWPKGDGGAE